MWQGLFFFCARTGLINNVDLDGFCGSDTGASELDLLNKVNGVRAGFEVAGDSPLLGISHVLVFLGSDGAKCYMSPCSF